ncbi:MAG: cytochrome c3 family protein [Euryarchaeota archaeon]|nr:cytochrome c3 family protein [Euryarchaeota archaeon]
MNVRSLLILLWILVIPLLGIAANAPQLFMPEKVSTGHAAFEEDCRACHVPWKGAPEQRCADCHGEERPIIDPKTHGAECRSCHLEHRGRVVRIAKFDHAKVAYEMSADHDRLNCRECHAEGYTSFSARSCADCHSEPEVTKIFDLSGHVDFYGAACIQCHRRVSADLKRFDHASTGYLIVGGHFRLDCKECHPEKFTRFTCNGPCHEKEGP